MINSISLFLSFILLAPGEIAQTESSGDRLPEIQVTCHDDPDDLQANKAQQKKFRKKPKKYDAYKKILSQSTDQEIVARLVYAEVLAAKCPRHNKELYPAISHTLHNRIKAAKGDVKSVVFRRDQFASSMNVYGASQFREFLCPKKDPALFSRVSRYVSSVLSGEKENPFPSNAVNYYLHQHWGSYKPNETKWGKTWAKQLEVSDCATFYLKP